MFFFSSGLLKGTRDELERKLESSATLYVGNLSFFTTEEQIQELFSRAGDLKKIIMGLDKIKKVPCGFCFVEYPLLLFEMVTFRFSKLLNNLINSVYYNFGKNKTPGKLPAGNYLG